MMDGDTLILCDRCGRPIASRSPFGVLRVKHGDWEVLVAVGDIQVRCGHHQMGRDADGRRQRCGAPHRLVAGALPAPTPIP